MAQLQITIDDGPQPVAQALDPILAELANRHVHGAFFCLGQEVQADPAASRKIREGGHVIGNHSWDHLEPHTPPYSDGQIKDQFQRTHAAVLAATQITMRHWRAPRGEQIARLSALLTTGPNHLYELSHCDWHADSKDSQGANNSSQMLQAIRGAIAANLNRTMFRLLFHVQGTTAAALPTVLSGLVSDGHTLVDFAQTA
jgi:peptidoglycan/xylan/chitin deacetylase (PgdA/CDA1 family)